MEFWVDFFHGGSCSVNNMLTRLYFKKRIKYIIILYLVMVWPHFSWRRASLHPHSHNQNSVLSEMVKRLTNDEFLVELSRALQQSRTQGTFNMSMKRCKSFLYSLIPSELCSDPGDEYSRKSTIKNREATTKKSQCLIRVSSSGKEPADISTVIDDTNCALFQKRVNMLLEPHLF